MEPAETTRFTEDEYLALETASQTRHEFLHGEIIAMAGGSPLHSLIAANTTRALGSALRGKPCAVLSSDVAVYIEKLGAYLYPDVSVVCGTPEFSPKRSAALRNPVLVVEALSASTRVYDLGAKFEHLRKLPSLTDFLAVQKSRRFVQHWHRTEVGSWLLSEVEGEGVVDLPGFGIALPLGEVYEKVELFPKEE